MKRLTKRGILLLLALAVLVVCVACGGGGSTPTPANGGAETAQTSEGGETPVAGKTEEQPVTPPETTESADADELYQLGVDALEGGNINEARSYLKQAADKGKVYALYHLGNSYYDEDYGDIDVDKAREYWEEAADKGDVTSAFSVAILYENAKHDYMKAVAAWEKAGELGHASSYNRIGYLYENGVGDVPQDEATALKYYQKALDLGYEEAAAKVAELSAKLNG